MTAPRLMYWPNEPIQDDPARYQLGGRHAFTAMLTDGTVGALDIYPFRRHRAEAGARPPFEDQALDHVRSFRPDILFVQHLAGTDISEDLWRRIREALPETTIVYHEADPFDRQAKRIDEPTTGILRQAHLVLAVGLGSLAEILAEPGNLPVQYSPHCFDRARFAAHEPATEKTHDIVMIANRGVRRRLKFLYVPGGRRRAQFVKDLNGIFGARFALYGSGWDGLEAARGRTDFLKQEQTIQTGRISANWDHFDEIPYYFSDRLPISLAAGVPHVTTYHPGYEHIFRDCPGLYACRTVEEAVDCCRWLLSRPDEDLHEEGLAARRWAFAHLEADDVFREAFSLGLAFHQGRSPK